MARATTGARTAASTRFLLENYTNSLKFASDVSGDKVQVKNNAIISGQTNLAISANINFLTSAVATAGHDACIYSERPTGTDIFKFEIVANTGKLRITYRDDALTLNQLAATTSVKDGKWHHVVMTKVGTAVKFYIDTVLDATVALTATDNFTVANRTAVIGKDPQDNLTSFTGYINDVRLYIGTLVAADVSNLYYSGINPSAPVGWWKFNEGTGSTATDSSSGGNNGAITTAAWSTFVAPPFNTRSVSASRTAA